MLAQLPVDEIDDRHSRRGTLERTTERTIVDPDRLHDELALIRQRAYATNLEESEPGVSAVGAALPVTPDGQLAPISVSAPSGRFVEKRLEVISRVVIEATSTIAIAT